MTLAISHNFQPKQVIRSTEVNTDLNEIVSYVNTLETSVNDGTAIADGAITTAKLDDSAVTNAKMADAAIDTVELADGAVTTIKIEDAAVTSDKIAAAVAGDGLSGGAGSALSVNVDNSTVELNSDSLRVRDAGITEAKLASAVVNKLGQNIGLVFVRSASLSLGYTDVVNITAQGRLLGLVHSEGSGGLDVTLTIDGVTYDEQSLTLGEWLILNTAPTSSSALFSDSGTTGGQWNNLNLFFKTSLRIQAKGSGLRACVLYERSA